LISYTIYNNEKSTEWVTFVHGAGGSSSIWFKQIRDFKKQYNVLLLDLRGHGNSKSTLKTAFKSKYTFSDIADDIIEVLDFLEIQKSHFVGISLGTILIRQLAEMHPHRVESMILGWSNSEDEFSFANINETREHV
jgi:pimeloyl-ACP methyl ester carboxylesterase